MNHDEHLLTCLGEECVEVAQRVSKALRFGLEEVQPGKVLTNAQRIVQELTDVAAIVEMMEARGLLPVLPHHERHDAIVTKQQKVEAFMNYAASRGALLPPGGGLVEAELLERVRVHSEHAGMEVEVTEDFRYLLNHFLKLGLDAKDAEIDRQSAELF